MVSMTLGHSNSMSLGEQSHCLLGWSLGRLRYVSTWKSVDTGCTALPWSGMVGGNEENVLSIPTQWNLEKKDVQGMVRWKVDHFPVNSSKYKSYPNDLYELGKLINPILCVAPVLNLLNANHNGGWFYYPPIHCGETEAPGTYPFWG